MEIAVIAAIVVLMVVGLVESIYAFVSRKTVLNSSKPELCSRNVLFASNRFCHAGAGQHPRLPSVNGTFGPMDPGLRRGDIDCFAEMVFLNP